MSRSVATKLPSISKIPINEKVKGTIAEKWVKYWKNLYIDYTQMLKDLRTDIQDEPRKALYYISTIAGLCALHRNTPTERDFHEDLKKISNEMILVGEDCQKPQSYDQLRYLQVCNTQGTLRYASAGIVSFMYLADYNERCSNYKAKCSYLTPSYFSYPSRIVDVGFMGKWWNLFMKTTDYDVNI